MSLRELVDAGLTSDKVAVILAPYEKLEETIDLMIERNQPVEITISGVWPDSNPASWGKDKKDEIREKCRKIDQVMRSAGTTASMNKTSCFQQLTGILDRIQAWKS